MNTKSEFEKLSEAVKKFPEISTEIEIEELRKNDKTISILRELCKTEYFPATALPDPSLESIKGLLEERGHHHDLSRPRGPDNPSVNWYKCGWRAAKLLLPPPEQWPVMNEKDLAWNLYPDGKYERKSVGNDILEVIYGTNRGGNINLWLPITPDNEILMKKKPIKDKHFLFTTGNYGNWRSAKGEFDDLNTKSDITYWISKQI